jgi:hypothetical protein
VADRCHKCGRPLTNRDSLELGYGPECADELGIGPEDWLPQRCGCCRRPQYVLKLLYGVEGIPRHVERWDGSDGWVDPVTGLVVLDG